MSVFWKGEKAAFEGEVTKLSGQPGKRKIVVTYADGDVQHYQEDDDSFDADDWRILPTTPKEGPQPVAWAWREVPFGAQEFTRLQMELYMEVRFKILLGQKKSRPLQWAWISLPWDEMTHRFFFDTLAPIHIRTDEEFVRQVFPRLGYLPFKALGRRSSKKSPHTKIQICSEALIRRSMTGSGTVIYFTYSRFDQQEDGSWDRAWVPPQRPIGTRPPRKMTKRKRRVQ